NDAELINVQGKLLAQLELNASLEQLNNNQEKEIRAERTLSAQLSKSLEESRTTIHKLKQDREQLIQSERLLVAERAEIKTANQQAGEALEEAIMKAKYWEKRVGVYETPKPLPRAKNPIHGLRPAPTARASDHLYDNATRGVSKLPTQATPQGTSKPPSETVM